MGLPSSIFRGFKEARTRGGCDREVVFDFIFSPSRQEVSPPEKGIRFVEVVSLISLNISFSVFLFLENFPRLRLP